MITHFQEKILAEGVVLGVAEDRVVVVDVMGLRMAIRACGPIRMGRWAEHGCVFFQTVPMAAWTSVAGVQHAASHAHGRASLVLMPLHSVARVLAACWGMCLRG